MAIGAVLCEFGDVPPSSFFSPLPPRSQVFAAFDGYEASLLLFTAVAVSGTMVYMTGYNFVGSSCVEVPVAALSHAFGFLLHTSSNGTRPHPGLLATSALSCWAATSVTTCCTSVTGVVRSGHLPVLLSFILSVRTFVFLVCVLLSLGCHLRSRTPLLAPTFTVLRNAPSRSRPRLIERLDLHRTHDDYEAHPHPFAASGC